MIEKMDVFLEALDPKIMNELEKYWLQSYEEDYL